jgi:hypothetical protein
MCSFSIHISFLVQYLFKYFAHFGEEVVCFLNVEF